MTSAVVQQTIISYTEPLDKSIRDNNRYLSPAPMNTATIRHALLLLLLPLASAFVVAPAGSFVGSVSANKLQAMAPTDLMMGMDYVATTAADVHVSSAVASASSSSLQIAGSGGTQFLNHKKI